MNLKDNSNWDLIITPKRGWFEIRNQTRTITKWNIKGIRKTDIVDV